MDQDREPKLCTTSGESVEKVRAEQTESTGQHKSYVVLCPDERAKGFVRPYRDEYKHVGVRPQYPLRDLTGDEQDRFLEYGYVKFEEYPECNCEPTGVGTLGHADTCPRRRGLGKYWTLEDLNSGCGTVTRMGRSISETYARDPKFYGATFCCGCNRHIPVEQFVWTHDGERVGS